MYATNRIRVKGRTKPAPVRTTIVLFDGGRKARVPNFGAGLLRSVPSHRLLCTLADLDAVAGLFAESDRERAEARLAEEDRYNEILDQRELELAFEDRYVRGFCL